MAPSADPPTGQHGDRQPQLWKIAKIGGKDFGLVATQDIAPGTLLLSEAPLLTTANINDALDLTMAENQFKAKFAKLPRIKQAAFMNLHNNYPSEPEVLSNIVRSNGYPLGAGAEVGGVFENISRINHSCCPNAVQSWNPLEEKENVFVVRTIKEGQEILTSYHVGGPSSERKAVLKAYFGFDCTCEICSLPTDQQKISDERFEEMGKLDELIGNSKKVRFNPEEVLASCHRLLTLYSLENIKDDRLSRLYFDAFQVCNMHSDQARARVFAKQYVSAKKIAAGECEGVLEVRGWMKEPRAHESFGVTRKWESGKGEVLKGVGRREFEEWLWRVSV